jgi:hypothetical protein
MGSEHEAALIFIRRRPDYMAVIECIGEDGGLWVEVIRCMLSRGAVSSMGAARNRIAQLEKYGVVERHIFGRNVFLTLSRGFLRTWRRSSQGHRGRRP